MYLRSGGYSLVGGRHAQGRVHAGGRPGSRPWSRGPHGHRQRQDPRCQVEARVQARLRGKYNIYMRAVDALGGDTGWKYKGWIRVEQPWRTLDRAIDATGFGHLGKI